MQNRYVTIVIILIVSAAAFLHVINTNYSEQNIINSHSQKIVDVYIKIYKNGKIIYTAKDPIVKEYLYKTFLEYERRLAKSCTYYIKSLSRNVCFLDKYIEYNINLEFDDLSSLIKPELCSTVRKATLINYGNGTIVVYFTTAFSPPYKTYIYGVMLYGHKYVTGQDGGYHSCSEYSYGYDFNVLVAYEDIYKSLNNNPLTVTPNDVITVVYEFVFQLGSG